MKRRDFIQEVIDELQSASKEIQDLYTKLKDKTIGVEEFEQEYKDILYNIKGTAEDECYYPNNACTYVLNDGSEIINK